MAFKVMTTKVYMEPVVVTNGVVGTGNGSTMVFNLSHTDIQAGTLHVFVAGTEVTTGWTADYPAGMVTFATAPANGAAITASYQSGPSMVGLVATAPTVVLGLHLGNVHASAAIGATIRVVHGGVLAHILLDASVPVHSGLAPLVGKLVLEAGDGLHLVASANDGLEAVISYMETA